MFRIIFDNDVIDFLNKVTEKLRKRIFNKIISTKNNPHRYFEKLRGRKDYKLRIGDYRAVADIDRTKKIVQITLIDHRKKVYKRHR